MNKLLIIITAMCITACEPSANNYNKKAANFKAGVLTENPLLENVITSSINTKTNSMATLYGNNVAFKYARYHANGNYPSGAVLYLVTWAQEEDPAWFGAKIPRELLTIEKLSFVHKEASVVTNYTAYKGSALEVVIFSKEVTAKRIKAITAQKMAVTP